LAITSEKLTALITDSPTARPQRFEPGSWFRMARSAEASRTNLLTAGLSPALGDQLGGQGPVLWDVPPEEMLRTPQGLLTRLDPQFIPFEADHDFVTLVKAKHLPVP